jgi:methenyltetrahydromethanopterin cyclohydrolase
VETALHKLHELGFDLSLVESGFGTAPLPPVAADQMQGIGRTNDAILYGGQVVLWVREEDERLEGLVGQVPSKASRDYGVPFSEIFARYDNDFYRIDPHLFSPATVTIVNLHTGRSFSAGAVREDLLEQSFSS